MSADQSPDTPLLPKRLSLGLMGVAVLSSIAASTCCVLPLVLVLIGLTGAWMVHLAVLKPFVGVFTVIALIALAAAGYLVFRPQPEDANACSVADGACDSNCRSTRKTFIVCALFIGLLLLFPFIAPLFY